MLSNFKQFVDELKDLKQQPRVQQEQHRQIVQRLQLGMDERDKDLNAEVLRLRRQLGTKQTIVDDRTKILEQTLEEQNRLLAQTKKRETTDEQALDPMSERFKIGKDSWQGTGKRKDHNATEAPMYATGATTTINKAIDIWTEDYTKHGGDVADRNVVDAQIAADWGVRARRRLIETGIESKGTIIITNTTDEQ